MVKLGDKNAEVAEVQKLLSLIGYDLITDGSFGAITQRSVKAFQKKYGLLSDGIVGDKTMIALRAAQKKNSKEDGELIDAVNYNELEIDTTNSLPDSQYIKQVTPKSQIFIHFTAGGPSAINTIGYWESDEQRVATTYVIDGNSGGILQTYNPDYWSFHLGVKGTNGKLDKASIGIEICAFGPLVKKDGNYYAWPKDFSTKVNSDFVYPLDEPFRGYSYFYKYSDKQLENLEKLLLFLVDKYQIKVQKSFDKTWFEYKQDVINNCLPGIWTHVNVRKDKSDSYPDDRLLNMLNRIAKKVN